MTRALRPTRAMLVASAVVATLAVGGCSQMSPQTTQLKYAASDGVMGNKGALGVRNLMLIASDEGGEANVVGTFVNTSDSPLNVTLATEAGPAGTVTVPANSSTAVGPEDANKATAKVGGKPGALAAMKISAGSDQLELKVPILDGTLPEYSTLVPTASASASTSETASGSETSSASPTSTP